MESIDFKERLLIRADVATKMRFCDCRNAKILCAYKLLNMVADNKKEMYADVLKEYLEETDYGKVIAETSFGYFGNIGFWVYNIVEEIEDGYYHYSNYYDKFSVQDVYKGSICIFIEESVAPLSKKAARLLLNVIINDPNLEFLHTVAFYERENLDTITEYEDNDENYLDLLETTFNPYITIDAYNIEHEEETRKNGIRKMNNKVGAVISQMSFKHLL